MDSVLYITIATTILFSLGAFRMLLVGNNYKAAFFNFLNFSNLLVYTFNIVHGLLYSAIPVVVFFLWKTSIVQMIGTCSWCIYMIILVLSILSVWYFYFKVKMSYRINFILKYVTELGVFSAGVLLWKCPKIENFSLVVLGLIIVFLFLFLKITTKFEYHKSSQAALTQIQTINLKNGESPLILTDGSLIITNTMEFVFIHDKANKAFRVIPMAEIKSIEYTIN
jgi:hypothetical protein